jgi:hypothetical protein
LKLQRFLVLVVVVMIHVMVMIMVVGAIPPLLLELFASFARLFAIFTMALDGVPKPSIRIVDAFFATHSTVVVRAGGKCGSYQADNSQHCNTKKPDRTSHKFSSNSDFLQPEWFDQWWQTACENQTKVAF